MNIGSMKYHYRALIVVLLVMLGVFVAPSEALAVVQNLNGATGMSQTFLNDSNVQVSTSPTTNVHSFIWNGLLPVSRGGTGVSSFSAGSVLFSNGTSISQDNSNFYWDNVNKSLGIGATPAYNKLAIGDGDIDWSMSGKKGVSLGYSSYNDNDIWGISVGQPATTLSPRGIEFFWEGNHTDDNAIGHIDTGYFANPIYIDASNIIINALVNSPEWGGDAKVGIGLTNPTALLDVAGTIKGDSTLFLGSSSTPACIEMADSDGSGVGYVTINDGVLSASTTKPSFCQ